MALVRPLIQASSAACRSLVDAGDMIVLDGVTREAARLRSLGPMEKSRWSNSTEAWRNAAEIIESGEWGEILDLDMPPIPIAP